MKFLLTSIAFYICTRLHILFNKNVPSANIIVSDNEGRHFLDFLPYTRIIQNTSHSIYTFVNREQNHINTLITTPFPTVCYTKKSFERLYKEYTKSNWNPILANCKKLIVVDEYSLPNATLVELANKKQILTVGVQHGAIFPGHKGYENYKKQPKSKTVHTFLCYSKYEKKFLADSQITNIEICGSPRHDAIQQCEPHTKTLVWFTQSHSKLMKKHGENWANIKMLSAWLTTHKDWKLLIKLHPNENQWFTSYRLFQMLKPKRITITKKMTVPQALELATFTITKNSTVGYDSILSNTPCIILNLKDTLSIKNYTDFGYPYIASDSNSFNRNIDDFNRKKFSDIRKTFVENRFPYYPNSTQYLLQVIDNL